MTSCCVCQLESSGAHSCSSCQQNVHVTCGIINGDEGWGCSVICNNCAAEPPAKKTSSLNIAYPSTSQTLKHKVPNPKKQTEKNEWKSHCVCLTCFENGIEPNIYVMSRRDTYTKNRHILRRHPQLALSQIRIVNFDANGKEISSAREKYFASSSNSICKKNGSKTQGTLMNFCSVYPIQQEPSLVYPQQKQDANRTNEVKILHTEPTRATPIVHEGFGTDGVDVDVDEKNDKFVTSQGTGSVAQIASTEPTTAGGLAGTDCKDSVPCHSHSCSCADNTSLLNSKMDEIIKTMKELKVKTSGLAPAKPVITSYLSLQNNEVTDWKNISNIINLSHSIPEIKFYGGNHDNSPSVLRCETCFQLLSSRFTGINSAADPRKTALRGIGKYSGSLSSGLLLSPEKTESIIKGGNNYWYGMKNAIKQHISCDGEHSQLHFEALQYAATLKKRKSRGLAVTENLIRIALSVVKSKSAAQQFEHQIAAHIATGSDMGDLGHSRNHFNEILSAINVWLDKQTANQITKPLPSTGFQPHFYVSCDKSTPHRISNHAIMICPVVSGKRVAIPVNSPEVYSEDSLNNDGVSGGCANQLAKQAVKTIKEAYGDAESFDLKATWQGTCCDGQYQADGFKTTIYRELEVPIDPEFSVVVWDQSHWINLAILDIKDGKIGSSSDFLASLVKRSKNIHSTFQRGKMLSNVIALAHSEKLGLRMTRGNCATRFWSSQYMEFNTIIQSYKAYTAAFRSYGYNEMKEYDILGTDFVLDLCCICDSMQSVVDLMIAVQGLSCPCWKICVWLPRVKEFLERLMEEDITDPSESMPILKEHIGEIMEGSFKGQKLVQGWKLVSQDEANCYWEARDTDDCQTSFETFVKDTVESLSRRYDLCVPAMCEILTCLDLENIITLLCGKRRHGQPCINEADLEEYGAEDFKSFISHVCSMEHVKLAIEDGTIVLNPRLSHILHRKLKQGLKDILWQHREIMINWFDYVPSVISEKIKPLSSVISKDSGNLSSMEKASGKSSQSFVTTRFHMQFANDEKMYTVQLSEPAVYLSLYTDESVYSKLGKEICLVIDIALAKGGPEAIVESFYSLMKCHKKAGGQNNETLSLRTKLDWSLPGPLQADRMVKEVATLYLDGDKNKGLKSHLLPIIGDKCVYKTSKVIDRIEISDTKLPYIL